MKKSIICLCLLVLCDKAVAAGDRSGIEPVGKSTASFLPPITPPLSGSPGNAGTPTITGSISGNDLLLATNGLIGKDIAWLLRVEQF